MNLPETHWASPHLHLVHVVAALLQVQAWCPLLAQTVLSPGGDQRGFCQLPLKPDPLIPDLLQEGSDGIHLAEEKSRPLCFCIVQCNPMTDCERDLS